MPEGRGLIESPKARKALAWGAGIVVALGIGGYIAWDEVTRLLGGLFGAAFGG